MPQATNSLRVFMVRNYFVAFARSTTANGRSGQPGGLPHPPPPVRPPTPRLRPRGRRLGRVSRYLPYKNACGWSERPASGFCRLRLGLRNKGTVVIAVRCLQRRR